MFSFIKKLFAGSSEGLDQAMLNGAVILDVRTASEFNQEHYAGSKNIPLNEIKLKMELIRKWNKPVITVCRTGTRSGIAKGILQAEGIEVYNGGPWTSLKNKGIK
jgi:rhodanese-related sulfurtransferase